MELVETIQSSFFCGSQNSECETLN